MKKYLSIAALALAGAIMTGCSNDDSIIDNPQPEKKSEVVTLTTTISLGGSDNTAGTTRALNINGVKTFKAGEQMAVIYHNGIGRVKAVSHVLAAGDISSDNKTATFTFDLETPDKSENVTYIYPASMANDDGTPNYNALDEQDGTLDALAKDLDYCTKTGAWNGDNLPSLTLDNQLAICEFSLYGLDGYDRNQSITSLTLTDGTYTYTVNRPANPNTWRIYVVIRPTENADMTLVASDGTGTYTKTWTMTYAAGNGYPMQLNNMIRVVDLSTLNGNFTAQNDDELIGTMPDNYQLSIAGGASVTLSGVNIIASGNYAGINCAGSATIVLKDGTSNIVKGNGNYPGIFVNQSSGITIKGGTLGTGTLDVGTSGTAAGIGGGYRMYSGSIAIQGGNITARGNNGGAGLGTGVRGGSWSYDDNATSGSVTISGGTVTAYGSGEGAGIGGSNGFNDGITITGGTVTAYGGNEGAGIGSYTWDITISGGNVTAIGGEGGAGIGGGENGDVRNITINGGTVVAKGGSKGAGIGNGYAYSRFYGIYITNGVTQVTATKGSNAQQSIGAGYDPNGEGEVGTIEITAASGKVIQN